LRVHRDDSKQIEARSVASDRRRTGAGRRFYDKAKEFALAGWVRNLGSGEVKIVAEGKQENLQMLAAWAHQGPPSAHVTQVREDWLDFTGEFTDFRIR
jgi:acylphosphatase